jgi:hypothetical protein
MESESMLGDFQRLAMHHRPKDALKSDVSSVDTRGELHGLRRQAARGLARVGRGGDEDEVE